MTLFGRRNLLDTDGSPISDDIIIAAYHNKQPSSDIMRLGLIDMIDGMCGPELIRMTKTATDDVWCMGIHDEVITIVDNIISDWKKFGYPKPESLYDIIERYVLEIKSMAPLLLISLENMKWLKSVFPDIHPIRTAA